MFPDSVLAPKSCSNAILGISPDYGKSPCFLGYGISTSADVDGSCASFEVSNITFGME